MYKKADDGFEFGDPFGLKKGNKILEAQILKEEMEREEAHRTKLISLQIDPQDATIKLMHGFS